MDEKEKELTPYRPNEWELATFQEKIHDATFAQYAYEVYAVDQHNVKLKDLYSTIISKIPTTIKRLNIWGGADEYNHGGESDSLTIHNIFRNEDMFKSVIRAIQIAEVVGYDNCKQRLTECGTYLNQIGHYEEPDVTKKTEEGFLLEVAIQMYYQAVYVTDRHETTQQQIELEFERQHFAANELAYVQILRHMPKNIYDISSEKELMELTCPNGDKLPKPIARRFFRQTILQLLRAPLPTTAKTSLPTAVSSDEFSNPMVWIMDKIHPTWFLDKFVSNGLTLTEHRALQYCFRGLKGVYRERLTFAGDDGDEQQSLYQTKYQWLQSLENNFKDSLAKQAREEASGIQKKETIDYSGDYGWYKENEKADPVAEISTVNPKVVLADLGNNDRHSKMMKNWLEKKSNNDESSATTPPRPRLPLPLGGRGGLLAGIIQQKANKN